MSEWPDEDELLPEEAGEPISQDALDALLSASADAGESDLDFGLDEALATADQPADADEAAGLGEPQAAEADFGFGSLGGGGFGGQGLGGASIELQSFDTPGFGGGNPSESTNEDFVRVRDIPLDVTVELGRTRLLIRDILDLNTGAIIELDKLAGEPVDLFANGLLVARGEVIVIDDNFGVRITEIITAEERLKADHAHSIAA